MCFFLFLLGIVLALVISAVILTIIGRYIRGRTNDESAGAVQFAVEDFAEELRSESAEYLEELNKVFSK